MFCSRGVMVKALDSEPSEPSSCLMSQWNLFLKEGQPSSTTQTMKHNINGLPMHASAWPGHVSLFHYICLSIPPCFSSLGSIFVCIEKCFIV